MLMILILGGSVLLSKEHKTLLVASEEMGLEVNVKETKFIVLFYEQNTRKYHEIKVGTTSLERAEEFRYLGKR